MDKEQIKKTIGGFIYRIIDDNTVEIVEESGLMEELELSSLEIMTLLSDVEREYRVVFREKDLRRISTVGDLILCIQRKKDEER